ALHEALLASPAAAHLPRLRRSVRSLDLYEYVTQLDRERTEQVAAPCVAGLAHLLQRGGGGTNASCTNRLRGPLQLVRGGGQLGKIASARGNVDLSLCLHRCFAEFR